jgi:hypothetical protein
VSNWIVDRSHSDPFDGASLLRLENIPQLVGYFLIFDDMKMIDNKNLLQCGLNIQKRK